jgi:hypothetical protein
VYLPKKGLSLILWEEGVEGPEGLMLGKIQKPCMNLPDASPQGSPKKAVKHLSLSKEDPQYNKECLKG